MGEIIKRAMKKRADANTPASGAHTNHSADWLYKKHLADQGLGPAPGEDIPGAPAPTTGATPPGGMVETDEDKKRKALSGLKI